MTVSQPAETRITGEGTHEGPGEQEEASRRLT